MDEAMQNGEDRRTTPFRCPEERRLVEMEHILKGNGKEGMQTRMARIEEKLDSLIKGKINWATIISIILSMGVVVLMIIALTQGLPS